MKAVDIGDEARAIREVVAVEGDERACRPDMKLVISRAWNSPESRLNGLFQLTKGLSGIVRKAKKRENKAA